MDTDNIIENQIHRDIYKAVSYIHDSHLKSVKSRPQTIKSFLAGTENSPFYLELFHEHPDICGKYPSIKLNEVMEALKDMIFKGFIFLEGSDYFIAQKIADDSKSGKVQKTNPDVLGKREGQSPKNNEWIIKANCDLYDHKASFRKNG